MTREPESEESKRTPADTWIVSEEILKNYGAALTRVPEGRVLFEPGDPANHFFVVKSGRIRMVTTSDRGREFTQGWFDAGQSFGEPPFFAGVPYPARALAEVDSVVWKCPKESFLRLLHDHPEVHLRITRALGKRLVYKALMLGEIAIEEAEHRLATLIRYQRRLNPAASPTSYRVPFTRQQLADMTGLRVETVIRTIKLMETKGFLTIVAGRIVWNETAANQLDAD